MNFSEKLIRLRKREGISQEELASYLEVSRQAVSRWEQGTALPDAGNLLKLRQRFGVSVDWLLEDAQGWENLTDGAPTGSEGGGTAPSPKLRKSEKPYRHRKCGKACCHGLSRWECPASACCCLEFSRRYSRRNIWSRPQ